MKKAMILFGLALLFISTAFAQDKPKGYYSINNKYKKPGKIKVSAKLPVATKGYYSISGNEKKMAKQLRWYYLPATPVESKGYYSIPEKKGYKKSW